MIIPSKVYRQEVGEWLGQFEWTLYGTFSFRRYIRTDSALKTVKRFITSLDPNARFVLAVRHYQDADKPHIHSLINGLKDFDCFCLMNLWYGKKYGIARISPYDKNGGASYYLAKNAQGDWGELDVSGM